MLIDKQMNRSLAIATLNVYKIAKVFNTAKKIKDEGVGSYIQAGLNLIFTDYLSDGKFSNINWFYNPETLILGTSEYDFSIRLKIQVEWENVEKDGVIIDLFCKPLDSPDSKGVETKVISLIPGMQHGKGSK